MSGTSVPYLVQYAPGQGVISAAWLNTAIQGGCYLSNLRSFVGIPNQNIQMIGFLAQNDGGQGTFVWSSSTGTDDGGITTIVPYGVTQGCWLRQIPGYVSTIAVVSNIAGLRNESSSTLTGNAAYVEGYTTGADGGEGIFWYNPTDTTSADNGGTIIVDASGRRWYREGAGLNRWPITWFGASTSASDNTAIVQGMITAMTTGGVITSPAGTFNFLGSLSIQGNGISIQGAGRGATTWLFDNAIDDCIVIGAAYTTVVSSTQIMELTIGGSGKTGGSGVSILSGAQTIIRDVVFSNMANGIYCQFINNVTIEDCFIQLQNAANYQWGVKWYAVAAAAQAASGLTLSNIVINAYGNAVYGVWMDGACKTLISNNVRVIHANCGLYVGNSQKSNQYYPEFLFFNGFNVTGVTYVAVNIQAGRQMKFVNCDLYNNFSGETSDFTTVYIASDGGYSVTSLLWFANCRIGGAQQNGVVCYGKNVFFTGCSIAANSMVGVGQYNGVLLANDGGTNGAASGVTISGGNIGGAYGDLVYQAYGLSVSPGCTRVTIEGVDFNNNATGCINDNSGGLGNVFWHGCYDINGLQLADRLAILPVQAPNPVNASFYYNSQTSTLQVFLNGALKTVNTS